MRDCLFCGTFNPVHNAHLRAAEYVLKEYDFDNVVFIPTYIAPHKEVWGCSAADRFNMVKLAISGNKQFILSDIEFQSDLKSYTFNTVFSLNKKYSTEKQAFIIGMTREGTPLLID